VEWFVAAVVVAGLGVAALAAAGRFGEMRPEPDRDVFAPTLPDDRPLTAADLEQVRFGVTLRGYSMRQVDALLDRLVAELGEAERQR